MQHAGSGASTGAASSDSDTQSDATPTKKRDTAAEPVKLETVLVLQPDGRSVACAVEVPAGSQTEPLYVYELLAELN